MLSFVVHAFICKQDLYHPPSLCSPMYFLSILYLGLPISINNNNKNNNESALTHRQQPTPIHAITGILTLIYFSLPLPTLSDHSPPPTTTPITTNNTIINPNISFPNTHNIANNTMFCWITSNTLNHHLPTSIAQYQSHHLFILLSKSTNKPTGSPHTHTRAHTHSHKLTSRTCCRFFYQDATSDTIITAPHNPPYNHKNHHTTTQHRPLHSI